MAIKALGIAASGRRGGNSEVLLDRALAGAKEAGSAFEKVVLVDLHLNPCICPTLEDCRPAGICSVRDDMQALYHKLLECDLLFVASPIFFRSVSAQLKAMIDRCQALWVRKYQLRQELTPHRKARRPGLFISVAAEKTEKGFQAASVTVRSLFATLNVRYSAELFLAGVEGPGDVLGHTEYLERAYQMGFQLARQEMSGQGRDG